MMMNCPRRRHGQVFLEVLVALILLALNGLLIGYAFDRLAEIDPWYAWTFCALILPVEAIALGVITMAIDRRELSRRRQARQQAR